MRIIAKSRLFALADRYGDCRPQVEAWHTAAKRATWHHLADVRKTFPHADQVGDKTVFNIKGNDYRLIVYIEYAWGKVFIKDLLTHAEYDKGRWKDA